MYTINRHLAYSVWANNKIAETLNALDPALIDTETPSSFNTIRKTIYHIWDAETIWFTRIQGGQATSWPSENFSGTFSEALQAFTANTAALAEFVKDRDRNFLDTHIHYKNLTGLEFAQPVEDILFHVVNHGSFHRGQVITMLRALGHTTLPNTDLITFMRTQQKNS
jgi:uncharacterized damage-inducible protein DinB